MKCNLILIQFILKIFLETAQIKNGRGGNMYVVLTYSPKFTTSICNNNEKILMATLLCIH